MGTKLYSEFVPSDGQKLTAVKIKGPKVIIALQGGTIKQCRLRVVDKATVTLEEVAKIEMGAEVSGLCISDDSNEIDLVYATLYDAPHYSLNVLHLSRDSELQLLARIPLSSILQMPQTKKYYHHRLVKNGQVFQ